MPEEAQSGAGEEIVISCVIPAKDMNDPKLRDLIMSIRLQDFHQDEVEILIMGPKYGDSEQAKAEGIRQAKGKIIGMFCSDNMIMDYQLFRRVENIITGGCSAAYPNKYYYSSTDHSLNRYFSLIGGNDPVSYYLGKNDREPRVASLKKRSSYPPSYGCNGFFYRAKLIKSTDLNHYYPMDNALELIQKGHQKKFCPIQIPAIWHRTSDHLLTYLKRRYIYARELYCDRDDRRWRMVDTKEDKFRIALYIFFTLTIVQPVYTSIKGFTKIRDFAWFWHWPVCFGLLITYGILVCRNLLKHQSLFQQHVQNACHD